MLTVLLGSWRQMQQRLFAVRKNTPGGQHRLPRLAQMQPLGNPVDKQVSDLKLRQIARRERLIFRPQALCNLAHRGAAEQACTVLVGKQRFDIARRKPACIHLHRQGFPSGPRTAARMRERNGSLRSAICGAL